MEDIRSIRSWFQTMNEAVPSEENERLFLQYIDPVLGAVNEDEFTEETLNAFLKNLEEAGLEQKVVFDVLSLLRSLLSFISRQEGRNLPLPDFSSELFRRPGIPEANAFLLNELLIESRKRHAAAFWLLLHTDIPFSIVQRFRARDIAVRDGSLYLTYDQQARTPEDEEPVDPDSLTTRVLSPDEKSLHFWEIILAKALKDGDNYLISGTDQLERRRELEKSLNLFAGKCGLCNLTLDELSKTEWDWDEAVDSVANFNPEVAESFFFSPERGGEKTGEPEKLSINELNDAMEVFPTPVKEHCRRTVQIAEFLIERLREEEWFYETDLDLDSLAVAVYYHDIGKTQLNLDDYYSDGAAKSEQNTRYRTHVERGIEVLREIAKCAPEDFSALSLSGMIRDAVADHHERVDGKGFPAGKSGEEISLVGRICSIADTVDRSLFFTDSTEKDPSEILDKIIAGAGTRFDARLVTILSDNQDLFVSFLEELRSVFFHQRTEDAYGMRFVFHPYVDMNGTVSLTEAHLFFNDPYYGLMDSDIILPVLEDHPRYTQFTRFEIKRICRLISIANDTKREIPIVCLNISVKEAMKENFFTTVFRIFVDNGIQYHQLMFSINEDDVLDNAMDISGLVEKFHMIGALLAISNFGGDSTLLPSLLRIRPDAVILQRRYAQSADSALRLDFINMILQTGRKLDFDVYCPGVDNSKQHSFLSRAGIQFFGGAFVGLEQSEAEFIGEAEPVSSANSES